MCRRAIFRFPLTKLGQIFWRFTFPSQSH
jgi:hypothetical protein